MTQASKWWASLTLREQGLIALMIVLALGIGLIYGVLRPITSYYDAGVRAVAASTTEATRVRSAIQSAGALQKNATPKPSTTTNVRAAISETALTLGITVTRLQPDQNGNLTVWLDAVPSDDFFHWLRVLQSDHGVSVAKATVQKEDGSPVVRAQLVFRGLTP